MPFLTDEKFSLTVGPNEWLGVFELMWSKEPCLWRGRLFGDVSQRAEKQCWLVNGRQWLLQGGMGKAEGQELESGKTSIWRGTKKPLDESEGGEWKSWLKAQHSENSDHGIWSHHFMGNRWGNSGNTVRLFFWAPKSLQMVIAAMKLKDAYSLKGKLWPTWIAYLKAETLLCQQSSV